MNELPRPAINSVFTPRSHEVNETMYIRRPDHEQELARAVEGSLHSLICGESGSGKSWLYRHVAKKRGWRLFYANSGNAARKRSISRAIAESVFEENDRELVGYNQKLSGKIELLGLGGGGEAERSYAVQEKDILLRAFTSIRRQAGKEIALLVIDNLEALFSISTLMEELANIVLLLDDPTYATHKVKILLVGVPTEVVEYFRRTPNLESVGNRIKGVRALNSLNEVQITEFLRRGFMEQLRVQFAPGEFKDLVTHSLSVTLGIAERLHEYSEILGYRLEEAEWRYQPRLLEQCDEKFMVTSLRQSYAIIDIRTNERRTKTGRRNQVLYALGKISATTFETTQIEEIVREEFPKSTSVVQRLGIGQILADLSDGLDPLLRRAYRGTSYRFADPKYLMCLRVMLFKDSTDERVLKKTFRR
jgi:hypothetical protein